MAERVGGVVSNGSLMSDTRRLMSDKSAADADVNLQCSIVEALVGLEVRFRLLLGLVCV